jgi:hypothetical protein
MNARASAIQGKKLSGERIANLKKMSECPALLIIQKKSEIGENGEKFWANNFMKFRNIIIFILSNFVFCKI